jgi:hypothetical protein
MQYQNLLNWPSWFPKHDVCENYNFHKLHHNNRMLYESWAGQLIKGKTWFHFHANWPTANQNRIKLIPNDADTYVFSWHIENWDHDWLDIFCQTHPNQMVIAIGEFPVPSKHKNLKTLVYSCQHLVISNVLKNFHTDYTFDNQRRYRLSSLCNKPSFTKIFSTAYLLTRFYPRNDLLLSWNTNVQKEYCSSVDYVNQIKYNKLIEELADYYQLSMKSQTISYDCYVDNNHGLLDFANIAYKDSAINLTNETFAQGQRDNEIIPGPYLSEKSWKPLLAGTALVPVGQPGVYEYIKNLGFDTNYPWPCEFDNVPGDIDRLVEMFKIIDWIFGDQYYDNYSNIMSVNKNNFDYIRSAEFIKLIIERNQQNLENFLKNY